ncbi:MAG: SAM-dependent methyltransferase [Tannerella sp.]|nr:SAM-dependent methyltransferase [Tannerella sp.]
MNPLFQFIKEHIHADWMQLLLSANRYPDVDVPFAVEQIRARRMIREKLPTWYANPFLLFPSKTAVEQCSSEQTALYKQRLIHAEDHLCDLTGGLGIDTYFFALKAGHVTYIERSKSCFDMAMHNFSQLGLKNITGYYDDAENGLKSLPSANIIYVDPSRRNEQNTRFFALSDCEPDLVKIMPLLFSKAPNVIAKLSPMLDLRHTLSLLPDTTEIHVVSVRNECKELLFVCQRGIVSPMPVIYCVNFTTDGNEQSFDFMLTGEQTSICTISASIQTYLYEPNASILKAGGFKQIAIRFDLEKLHLNSHLYTSGQLIREFPGRIFQVQAVIPFDKNCCKLLHKTIPKAHISTRNFPLQANELRRRTRIDDGGDDYLFATTLANSKKVIIRCKKIE